MTWEELPWNASFFTDSEPLPAGVGAGGLELATRLGDGLGKNKARAHS